MRFAVPALLWSLFTLGQPFPARVELEPVRVAPGGRGFVLAPSGDPFVPWGVNYSTSKRLIEDFWDDEWATVEQDFAEMKRLGANVVRVHLQFPKFMDAPDRPNAHALEQLGRLLKLAERMGLHLDLTGLACFRKEDVPGWYDALAEKDRWAAQARFWEAVAGVGAGSPAVFCYDLMNEPLAPPGWRKPGDGVEWLAGKLGPFYFLQRISLDAAGRDRTDVAVAWVRAMKAAIRRKDKEHLITVGMLPSTPQWGHFSGFVPAKVGPELDFVSVHIYPESKKQDEALATLKGFVVEGKPLVIEETFPLACSAAELRQFLLATRGTAHGWIGHYEGVTPEELEETRRAGTITLPEQFMLDWLNLFREVKGEMLRPAPQ